MYAQTVLAGGYLALYWFEWSSVRYVDQEYCVRIVWSAGIKKQFVHCCLLFEIVLILLMYATSQTTFFFHLSQSLDVCSIIFTSSLLYRLQKENQRRNRIKHTHKNTTNNKQTERTRFILHSNIMNNKVKHIQKCNFGYSIWI